MPVNSMRGSSGASAGDGKKSTATATPASPPKKSGKRGAPQTFASKLFKVLQAAEHVKSSPVSWCLDGNSFTVHNDKDFETQVLTANYRHGKFSSFQRQLNMYGFRKVVDCSDRTYSHPFFQRDQPELLAQVRRVVNDPIGCSNADANLNNNGSPSVHGVKRPHAVPAIHSKGAMKVEFDQNDGGGKECKGAASRLLPVRKKPRRRKDLMPPSSSAALSTLPSPGLRCQPASAGGACGSVGRSSPTGLGNSSCAVFSHAPRQQQQQHQQKQEHPRPAVITTPTTITQHRNPSPCWPQHLPQHLPQDHHLDEEKNQQLPSMRELGAGGGNPNPSQQDLSALWGRHTGSWGGPTLTGTTLIGGGHADDGSTWTTASSSAASSVEDAPSPVLLPTTPASLDCSKSFVPPFQLQTDASLSLVDLRSAPGYGQHRGSADRGRSGIVVCNSNGFGSNGPIYPVLVSPAAGSSSTMMCGAGGGRGDADVDVLDAWRGDTTYSCAAATGALRVCSAPTLMLSEMKPPGQYAPVGLYSGGGGRGVLDKMDEAGLPSVDKSFGFEIALAKCPSFDLIFGRQEHSSHDSQPSMAQLGNPCIAAPGAPGPSDVSNSVVPVSPTASADEITTAADGWDLACLGGAGWGSPDTTESPAAGVWAAVPPLAAVDSSSERALSPRPSLTAFGGAGGALAIGVGGCGSGVGSSGYFMGGFDRQGQQLQQHKEHVRKHQQHKQQSQSQHPRMYNGNQSVPSVSLLGEPGGENTRNNGSGESSDPLDWALLGDTGADATAAAAGMPLSYVDEPSFAGVGGVVMRRAPPLYPMAAGLATPFH